MQKKERVYDIKLQTKYSKKKRSKFIIKNSQHATDLISGYGNHNELFNLISLLHRRRCFKEKSCTLTRCTFCAKVAQQ